VEDALIKKHSPRRHRHSPPAGRLGPICTVSGAALVGACSQLLRGDEAEERWDKSMVTLENAVTNAIQSDADGGDEVLYGRAGLLWGLLNFQALRKKQRENGSATEYVDREDLVAGLVGKIIDAGRRGRKKYQEATDQRVDKVLMWEWHGKMYLGAYVPPVLSPKVSLTDPECTVRPVS